MTSIESSNRALESNPAETQGDLGHSLTLPKHHGLVHILTPEFLGLDPADFEDIRPEVIERSTPGNLRGMLIDTRKDGRSTVSYPLQDSTREISISVTPHEFNLFFRHIPRLSDTSYNRTLDSRDAALQKATGNPYAKARTAEDLAAAERSGVHAVRQKQHLMQEHLKSRVKPRVELIDKFVEMTTYPNLVRGTRAAVRQRFEDLRLGVFGDMLDAVANQQKWKPYMADRAAQIIQKGLYLQDDPAKRQTYFLGMLSLAKEYYDKKWGLVMARDSEAEYYYRTHPDALQDVADRDIEKALKEDRRRAKKAA